MHTFCTYRDDKTAQERVTRTSQYVSRAGQDIIFFRGDNPARSHRLPHNVHRVFAPGFGLDPSPRLAAAFPTTVVHTTCSPVYFHLTCLNFHCMTSLLEKPLKLWNTILFDTFVPPCLSPNNAWSSRQLFHSFDFNLETGSMLGGKD